MDDVTTLASLIEAIVVEEQLGFLDDPDMRGELEEVVDRIRDRQPFLADAFSCHAVNSRFRQDEHHVLMHQRVW